MSKNPEKKVLGRKQTEWVMSSYICNVYLNESSVFDFV